MPYSVAIAAHNAVETLAETLASALSQTVPPAEIVVVDDGSTDGTAEIAEGVDRVTVIRQANTGVGAASSRAIRATSYPVVATVDADDLWLPEKMERQLMLLETSAPRTLIFAKHRQFHHKSKDRTGGKERPGLTRSDMVLHRAVFDEIGDFIDPPGGRGDVIDWLARAREARCTFKKIEEVLVLRRIIPGSLSFGRDTSKDRGYLAVAYEAMLRRRQRQTGD